MATLTLTHHAATKVRGFGLSPDAVIRATAFPSVRYPSRNHPGQERWIIRVPGASESTALVVDPDKGIVITAYVNTRETPLRPDQR